MSLKKIKFIIIFLLLSFISNASIANENLKSLGKFKDWESFTMIENENKVWSAQSIPLVRAPKKLKRDPSRLFVSFRPSENIKNEISVTGGYEYKIKVKIFLIIFMGMGLDILNVHR